MMIRTKRVFSPHAEAVRGGLTPSHACHHQEEDEHYGEDGADTPSCDQQLFLLFAVWVVGCVVVVAVDFCVKNRNCLSIHHSSIPNERTIITMNMAITYQ